MRDLSISRQQDTVLSHLNTPAHEKSQESLRRNAAEVGQYFGDHLNLGSASRVCSLKQKVANLLDF